MVRSSDAGGDGFWAELHGGEVEQMMCPKPGGLNVMVSCFLGTMGSVAFCTLEKSFIDTTSRSVGRKKQGGIEDTW